MPTTKSSHRLHRVRQLGLMHQAEKLELERVRERFRRRAKTVGGLEPHKAGAPTPDAITASVTIFVGACISAFLFFANPYLAPFEAYRLVNAACLFWIPCMVIVLFLKQDLSAFGLTHGERKFGLTFALVSVLVMLPVVIVAALRPDFKTHYGPIDSQPLAMVGYAIHQGWTPPVSPLGILYFEAIMGFYLFCWEFFYRGFLLFGLSRARWLGYPGAVIVQACVFALLHWSIVPGASKPPLEIASALVGGLILGWLAVRTKTFFYGFIIHWSIAAMFDFFLIASLVHV